MDSKLPEYQAKDPPEARLCSSCGNPQKSKKRMHKRKLAKPSLPQKRPKVGQNVAPESSRLFKKGVQGTVQGGRGEEEEEQYEDQEEKEQRERRTVE